MNSNSGCDTAYGSWKITNIGTASSKLGLRSGHSWTRLPFIRVLRCDHLILEGLGKLLAIHNDVNHIVILLELARLVVTYHI